MSSSLKRKIKNWLQEASAERWQTLEEISEAVGVQFKRFLDVWLASDHLSGDVSRVLPSHICQALYLLGYPEGYLNLAAKDYEAINVSILSWLGWKKARGEEPQVQKFYPEIILNQDVYEFWLALWNEADDLKNSKVNAVRFRAVTLNEDSGKRGKRVLLDKVFLSGGKYVAISDLDVLISRVMFAAEFKEDESLNISSFFKRIGVVGKINQSEEEGFFLQNPEFSRIIIEEDLTMSELEKNNAALIAREAQVQVVEEESKPEIKIGFKQFKVWEIAWDISDNGYLSRKAQKTVRDRSREFSSVEMSRLWLRFEEAGVLTCGEKGTKTIANPACFSIKFVGQLPPGIRIEQRTPDKRIHLDVIFEKIDRIIEEGLHPKDYLQSRMDAMLAIQEEMQARLPKVAKIIEGLKLLIQAETLGLPEDNEPDLDELSASVFTPQGMRHKA